MEFSRQQNEMFFEHKWILKVASFNKIKKANQMERTSRVHYEQII